MSRPTDWSPLQLHSDPTPGDPQVVSAYASRYGDVADAIKSAASKLTAIANHDDGESSKYVDAFRDTAKEVAGDITRAHERYSGLAQAMRDYANPLEQAQAAADAALQRARRASDGNSTAQTLHNHYEDELRRPDLSDDDRTKYTLLQQQAQNDLIDNQREIAAAQQDLQAAIDHRNSAARTATDAIKDVEDSGKLDDSPWTKFWEHNGGWIGEVVDIVGKVAAVLALVAIFVPGLGEVVLAIIAIVGIVAMALTVINAICQMTAGTKTVGAGLFEIGMAVIPFGVGKVLGHLGGAAGDAVEDTAATTLRTSKAAQGISKFTQSKALAQVDEDAAGVKTTLLQRWLSADAKGLAKMQAVGKADLTVDGASARVGDQVSANLWKFKDMPGIDPALQLSGAEQVVDDKLDGSKELQDANAH
jgi:hypothetical protein